MQKVKHYILSALALLGLVALAGVSFPATQAEAAVVCMPYAGGGGTWPRGYVQYCNDPSDAAHQVIESDAGALFIALSYTSNQLSGSVNLANRMTALKASNPLYGQYYLFYNEAAFDAWASAQANFVAPLAGSISGSAGYTQYTSTSNPLPTYSVFFKHIDSLNYDVMPNIKNVTTHETGHWYDALFSYLAPPTDASLPLLSNSAFYQHLRAADEAVLNSLTRQCRTGTVNNYVPGLFNKYQYRGSDNQLHYYCNTPASSGAGSGPTMLPPYDNTPSKYNSSILASSWPGIFFYSNQGAKNTELFAQEFATITLNSPDNGTGVYANYFFFGGNNSGYPRPTYNLYKCTSSFVTYIFQNRALPTAANLPAGCPAN